MKILKPLLGPMRVPFIILTSSCALFGQCTTMGWNVLINLATPVLVSSDCSFDSRVQE
ncbi:MAG: hypothetical protein ACK2T5_04500 [Anaerolineales bacterium]|jgi:hypothetical protein